MLMNSWFFTRQRSVTLAAILAPHLATAEPSDSLVYRDATAPIEHRVEDLLSRMTLREKIGQMIMDLSVYPETSPKAPDIGAYLVGLNDAPGNTLQSWRQHQNILQELSANHRLGIPVIIGTDAVHGHGALQGATIFPHNIGMGATRNPDLVKAMANITAKELVSSGIEFSFAPSLAVARTLTWGRTYESYSENPNLVRAFAAPFIRGMQGESTPWLAVATAKHWVGDGGTHKGQNAGDVILDNETLTNIHAAPYIDAIQADVGVVMVSFSSVHGLAMHEHQHLVQTVLKDQMGFEGFVLSDWNGFGKVRGPFDVQIAETVNAGVDMIMGPGAFFEMIDSITESVEAQRITEARINDAVTRILRVKFKAGLFEKKRTPINVDEFAPVGTAEHRAVARQAVRESLVLLKNDSRLLPLVTGERIFLAGKNADNINHQCGAWTMSWQGTSTEARHAIVGGTTIRDAMEKRARVTFNQDGLGANRHHHDLAVVVIGETPYAEDAGDRKTLNLDDHDIEVIRNVRASGLPFVVVLISGRPLLYDHDIWAASTVVAAWLPGTEGDGVADVLFGDVDFKGKLPFTWPRDMSQVHHDLADTDPAEVLYPFGHGLTIQ